MEDLLLTVARGLVEDKDAVRVSADEPDEEGVIVYQEIKASKTVKKQAAPDRQNCPALLFYFPRTAFLQPCFYRDIVVHLLIPHNLPHRW